MKKRTFFVVALTAILMSSFMSIMSIQFVSADYVTGYDSTPTIAGKEWYCWNSDSSLNRYSAIVLYDGTCSANYVSIDSLNSQYTEARMDLIRNLTANDYAVLTLKSDGVTYSSNDNTWLTEAAYYLQHTQSVRAYGDPGIGCPLVTLFGWGVGGAAVGYEIQKTGAESYYSAAVIAAAPVYIQYPGLDPIYYTAYYASNTKVPTAFICNSNDYEYYGSTYYQMQTYYNNMPGGLAKEWHAWNAGADAHDPFPDTCATHGGETVSDVTYNFESVAEGYESIEAIYTTDGTKNWYYWDSDSDSIAILLFGGYAYTGGYVWSRAFFFPDELNFLKDVYERGIDVITPKNEYNPYSTSSNWLSETAAELKNPAGDYDYDHVYLFGHSAGGAIVGYEIQQTGANSLYDAAVIAAGAVNMPAPYNSGVMICAQSASSAKVRTSFVCHVNDTVVGWSGMQLYYSNFNSSLDKEDHLNWGAANDPDPHTVVKDTCLDHPGETLADVLYNWSTLPTYQLTVEAYNQYSQPGYGIPVYIDDEEVGTTFNSFTVTHGSHEIEVESPLYDGYYHVFNHYEYDGNSDYNNPTDIWMYSDKTVTAYYYSYY